MDSSTLELRASKYRIVPIELQLGWRLKISLIQIIPSSFLEPPSRLKFQPKPYYPPRYDCSTSTSLLEEEVRRIECISYQVQKRTRIQSTWNWYTN